MAKLKESYDQAKQDDDQRKHCAADYAEDRAS